MTVGDYCYCITVDGVLFKFQQGGGFRSYNLKAVTRAVWANGVLKMFYGEDGDMFSEAGPAAEMLMRHYCRFASLDKEPTAIVAISDGTVESVDTGRGFVLSSDYLPEQKLG